MVSHGSGMPRNYLTKSLILGTLLGIVFLVFMFLRKKIIINKAKTVYDLIKGIGVKDPLAKFLTAQAAHETAGFTSEALTKYNNLFGMNYHVSALVTGKGLNNLAIYKDLQSSAKDVCAWLDAKGISWLTYIKELPTYVQVIYSHGYFTDTQENYTNGCQKYYNMIFGA
jgi:hypothetical protein